MHIWVGCDINPRFIEFRQKVKELNAEINASETAFNFPQHISLKITFEMEDEIAKHCLKDIIELLKSAKPFTVKTEGLEINENVLWIKMRECEELKFLHDELDQIAISYAVKQHPFDKNYIFHSTVIMDDDAEKLSAMYEKLKDIPYPEELKINTFIVGHSYDKVEYKVDRRIKVK